MENITKENIIEFLKEQKAYLSDTYKLAKIGIFGSFAKGNATQNSDIDLIVEFIPETEEIFEKKLQLKAILYKKFDRSVDVCNAKYIKPYYRRKILNETIYV